MRPLTTIFIICILFSGFRAEAQWNPDPNSPKQIVTASVSPQNIYPVKNGSEGFFLVWEDKPANGKSRILFNHYNLRGEVARTANGVETEGVINSQTSPKVTQSISGRISVIWSEETEPGKTALLMQQVNSRINFLWTDRSGKEITTAAAGNISEYSVALDRRMNTQIAWIEKSSNPSGYSVMVQRVDKNGNLSYGDGIKVEKGSYQKSSLKILTGSNGGASVCWIDAQGGSSLIKFATIDSTGKMQGDVSVLASVEGILKTMDIVTLSSGDHYLVWETAGKTREIFHLLVNAKGDAKWGKGGRQAVSNQGVNSSPVAVEGGDSTIVISWINELNGDENIFLQKFDRKGTAVWGINGVTIGSIKGRQFAQALDSDKSGGIYITWLDRRSGKAEIYAQKLSPAGKEEWDEEGVPVSKTQSPEKSYLDIFFDSKDGAILIFKEKNKKDEGIFGQRLAGVRPKVQGIVEAWLSNNEDEVKISWTATNEKNVISYFIHRMDPRGKDTAWTEIDNVVAHPNAQGSYYTFDAPDNEGKLVYRITQISKDNKVVSQKMVEGEFTRKTSQKIYVSQNIPNPFSGETTIAYNVTGVPVVKFEFFDSNFKLVKEESIKVVKEGKSAYVFKAEGLKPGIYFYRFTAGTYVEVKKMAII